MNERQAAIVNCMNQYFGDTTLQEIRERRGEHFRFPIYTGKALMEAELSEMELSVRAYNCLKRAGFHTVGDLVNGIHGKQDLLKFRNLGKRSANEIMLQLFLYQYTILSPRRKEQYMMRVKELNGM